MNLPITLKHSSVKTITLKLNAERFERLAGHFGYFSNEFLKSLARAERDYKEGRIRKLSSLKDLR